LSKSNRDSWTKFRRTTLFSGPPVKGWSIAVYDEQMAEVLNRYARPSTVKVIVEYGSGDGVWTEYLTRKHPLKEIWGYEWNHTLINLANQRCKGLKKVGFVEADVSEHVHAGCDLFFAFGVIEHFSNHVAVLSKWVSTLRRGGACILNAPNLDNLEWILSRTTLKLPDIQGKERVVTDTYGYEEIWSPKYFVSVIERAGLKLLEHWVVDRWHEHAQVAVCVKI